MTGPQGAVLDHTALVALGAGHQRVSALVAAAHREHDRYVFAPALCLAAAIAQQSGLANHLGVLPVVEIVDLDYLLDRGRLAHRRWRSLAGGAGRRRGPAFRRVADRTARRHRLAPDLRRTRSRGDRAGLMAVDQDFAKAPPSSPLLVPSLRRAE